MAEKGHSKVELRRIYNSLNADERFGLRFGLFPLRIAKDLTREDHIELMDIAEADPKNKGRARLMPDAKPKTQKKKVSSRPRAQAKGSSSKESKKTTKKADEKKYKCRDCGKLIDFSDWANNNGRCVKCYIKDRKAHGEWHPERIEIEKHYGMSAGRPKRERVAKKGEIIDYKGYKILHRHVFNNVYFSAWKGNRAVNDREISKDGRYLNWDNPLTLEDKEWLIGRD